MTGRILRMVLLNCLMAVLGLLFLALAVSVLTWAFAWAGVLASHSLARFLPQVHPEEVREAAIWGAVRLGWTAIAGAVIATAFALKLSIKTQTQDGEDGGGEEIDPPDADSLVQSRRKAPAPGQAPQLFN